MLRGSLFGTPIGYASLCHKKLVSYFVGLWPYGVLALCRCVVLLLQQCYALAQCGYKYIIGARIRNITGQVRD